MKRSREIAFAADDDEERPCAEVAEVADVSVVVISDSVAAVDGAEDDAADPEVSSPAARPVELFLLSVNGASSDRVGDRWGTPSAFAVSALEETPLFRRLVETVARGHVGATPWVVRLDLAATFPEHEDSRRRWVSRDDRPDFTDDALVAELEILEHSVLRCDGTIVGTIDVFVAPGAPPAAEDCVHDDVRTFLEWTPVDVMKTSVLNRLFKKPKNEVEWYIRDNLLNDDSHKNFHPRVLDTAKFTAFLTRAPRGIVADVLEWLVSRDPSGHVAFFYYTPEEVFGDDAHRTLLRKMKSREWGIRELVAYAPKSAKSAKIAKIASRS